MGVFIADHVASLNLVAGILAALHARAASGRGQLVESSLLGGQIWAQATEFTHSMLTGEPVGRANSGHSLIKGVYGIFETADGWIAIPGVPPHARDAFFIAIERPDLTLDDRLQDIMIHRGFEWLKDQLVAAFKTRSTDHWCEVLRDAGLRYAPVRDHRQGLDDPGAWENGYFAEVADEKGTTHRVVGTPIRMSETAPGTRCHGPRTRCPHGGSAARDRHRNRGNRAPARREHHLRTGANDGLRRNPHRNPGPGRHHPAEPAEQAERLDRDDVGGDRRRHARLERRRRHRRHRPHR